MRLRIKLVAIFRLDLFDVMLLERREQLALSKLNPFNEGTRLFSQLIVNCIKCAAHIVVNGKQISCQTSAAIKLGIATIPLNLALLRGCSIVGVDWGALARERGEQTRPVRDTLAEWLAAGEIRPLVTDRWPLAEAGAALRAVLERRVQGKAVLEVGGA